MPILDGSQVNLIVAFLAGIVTFFASCLLPLVPTYLAYLSGISLSSSATAHQRWRIVRMSVLFVAGFVTTFVILGLSFTQLSISLGPYRSVINKIAGLIFIVLGLFLLGAPRLSFFSKERRLQLNNVWVKQAHIHAFITGIAFGFGWTPCIGPVLAVILYWASQAEQQLHAVLLLVTYGLGLGVPFIVIGFAFEKLLPLLHRYKKVAHYATLISGVLILLVGLLLLLDKFQIISFIILDSLQLARLAA